MTRRDFINRLMAASVLGMTGNLIMPDRASATVMKSRKKLWLYHVHTGEQLKLDYLEGGEINPDTYAQVCHFMRDFHVNKSTQMDTPLLNLLNTVQTSLAKERRYQPIMVLSAYRTRETNERIKGAATNSMHLYGKAIDIYIPGIPINTLSNFGHQLRCGGVGTYQEQGFVHFDTGRVRYWGSEPVDSEDGQGDMVVAAQPKKLDPVASFNPQDARWSRVSRDELDTMIMKWRQRKSRLARRMELQG